jgi:hypothetical protein
LDEDVNLDAHTGTQLAAGERVTPNRHSHGAWRGGQRWAHTHFSRAQQVRLADNAAGRELLVEPLVPHVREAAESILRDRIGRGGLAAKEFIRIAY